MHFDERRALECKTLHIAMPMQAIPLNNRFDELGLSPTLTVVALHGEFDYFQDDGEDAGAFQVVLDALMHSWSADDKALLSQNASSNREGLTTIPSMSGGERVMQSATLLYGIETKYDKATDEWAQHPAREGCPDILTQDDVCFLRTTASGVRNILSTLCRSKLVVFVGHDSALASAIPRDVTIDGPQAMIFYNCGSEQVLRGANVSSTGVMFVCPTNVLALTIVGNEMM
jgi:hypothetical protein